MRRIPPLAIATVTDVKANGFSAHDDVIGLPEGATLHGACDLTLVVAGPSAARIAAAQDIGLATLVDTPGDRRLHGRRRAAMTPPSSVPERSKMARSRFDRLVAVAAAVAVATALPFTAAAASTRAQQVQSVPANLCSLAVKQQLKALGVRATCTSLKSAAGEAAHWGARTNGIGIIVWTSGPAARFKSAYGKLGTPVPLGSFAREADGPMGVVLNAWVGNVGLSVTLIRRAAANKTDRPLVLAFAKAVAKQL